MVTINDIAKASGVSHGTVSNVLNNRGNVSVEKIRLVEETAQKLGYRINAKAQIPSAGKQQGNCRHSSQRNQRSICATVRGSAKNSLCSGIPSVCI